ncbi:MAG TPA: hypothetical protein VF341_12705, partial [Anaeromyxobacteraceae bacterium]
MPAVVLGAVDLAGDAGLLVVDLAALTTSQVPVMPCALTPDLVMDASFPVLEACRLVGRQASVFDALGDARVLVRLPVTHFTGEGRGGGGDDERGGEELSNDRGHGMFPFWVEGRLAGPSHSIDRRG